MENEKNTMNATRVFSTAQEKPKRYESIQDSQKEKAKAQNRPEPCGASSHRALSFPFELSHSCQISFRSRLPRKGSRGVSLKFIRVTNLGFASSSKLVLRFSSPLNFTDLRSSPVGAPIQRAVPTRRDAAD